MGLKGGIWQKNQEGEPNWSLKETKKGLGAPNEISEKRSVLRSDQMDLSVKCRERREMDI